MKLPHIKLKLFTQMVLLISIVICATSILAAIFFTRIMDDLSAQYLGHEAMSVAKLAAQDDRIIRAFKSDNPSKEIQPIAEKMRKLTGAVISLSEINGVFVIPTPIRNILVNQWGRAMSLFLSSIYPLSILAKGSRVLRLKPKPQL